MNIKGKDKNKYLDEIEIEGKNYNFINLKKGCFDHEIELERLPISLRILLENIFRKISDEKLLTTYTRYFKNYINSKGKGDGEIDLYPSRILMQDFTGVPAMVDLMATENAIKQERGDFHIKFRANVDLVIDHSLDVKKWGSSDAMKENNIYEMENNFERYSFLKYASYKFDKLRLIPPASGICHQVNLEYLSKIVLLDKEKDLLYLDSVIGTDSHTPTVNSLSILAFGVGGIEAESVIVGNSIKMPFPRVVGVKLIGELQKDIFGSELVLHITNILRKYKLTGDFVEFFGPAINLLSVETRATISNMAPEQGSVISLFPFDDQTIKYLKQTGRDETHINIIKEYMKAQSLIDEKQGGGEGEKEGKIYSKIIEINLSNVKNIVAGPSRPQDKIEIKNLSIEFHDYLKSNNKSTENNFDFLLENNIESNIRNGDIIIAAITSCTNTSNPEVMIGAGLVLKRAYELGIKIAPHIKTSLAPGSKVVTSYLKNSGLNFYFDQMGFNLVGYGCTTCIGNSGEIDSNLEQVIKQNDLSVCSILSGNRNFSGRIHKMTDANFLASPIWVAIYSIIGNLLINPYKEPIANVNGKDIYLDDIMPSKDEIHEIINKFISPEIFIDKYKNIEDGDLNWRNIKIDQKQLEGKYKFDDSNTYIKSPPYVSAKKSMQNISQDFMDKKKCKIIAIFGDSVTTDHISPAGAILADSEAGIFMQKQYNIKPENFNSYGSRRGNHEIMIRGSFTNPKIQNLMLNYAKYDYQKGGFTITNDKTAPIKTIYKAAEFYKNYDYISVIFAGKDYGMGSSRDWAAKGTKLLGINYVVANSIEKIHRANLVCMGAMPLVYNDDFSINQINISKAHQYELQFTGIETLLNSNSKEELEKNKYITLSIYQDNKILLQISLEALIYNLDELKYIKYGGILNKTIQEVK